MMTPTRVYVPAGGVGGLPAHVSHSPLGETKGNGFAITATAMRANIPGVDLRQVQEVNGNSTDVGVSAARVDMTPRTHVLKK